MPLSRSRRWASMVVKRSSINPTGIAGRKPDADTAHVDSQPDPCAHASAPCRDAFANSVLDDGQRLNDLGGVGAPALCHIVLATAAATEGLSRKADQRSCLETPLPRRVVGRDDDHGTILGDAGNGHHARAIVAQPVSY